MLIFNICGSIIYESLNIFNWNIQFLEFTFNGIRVTLFGEHKKRFDDGAQLPVGIKENQIIICTKFFKFNGLYVVIFLFFFTKF